MCQRTSASEGPDRGERGLRGGGARRGSASAASLSRDGAVPAGKEAPFQSLPRETAGCAPRVPAPPPGLVYSRGLRRGEQRGVLCSRRSLAEGGRAGGLGSGIPRAQVAPPDRCSSVLGRSASMNPFLTTLCLCLGVVLGAPSLDPELDDHWQLWKSWHKKDYHEVSCRGTRSAGRALSARSWAPPAESCLLCYNAGYGQRLGSIILLFPASLCLCIDSAALYSLFLL